MEERFDYDGLLGVNSDLREQLADAQATVEALQAIIKQMGEQACVLAKDGMAAKAQVEALQRERDHAKNMAAVQKEVADNQTWHVRELTAALDAEREKVKGLHEITKVICTHCCEPMEIPSKAVLQTQLSQLQDWRDRVTLALQRAGGARFEDVPGHVKMVVDDLTQLRALVREIKKEFDNCTHECERCGESDPLTTFDIYRTVAKAATLDAMTPAGGQG